MIYEMRRKKAEPSHLHLLTMGIFNLLPHVGIVLKELVFDDAVSYTYWGKWIAAQINLIAVTGIRIPVPGSHIPCSNQLSDLPTRKTSLASYIDHLISVPNNPPYRYIIF